VCVFYNRVQALSLKTILHIPLVYAKGD